MRLNKAIVNVALTLGAIIIGVIALPYIIIGLVLVAVWIDLIIAAVMQGNW